MKVRFIFCLFLVVLTASCGKQQRNSSIKNSKWANSLVSFVFKDSTCTVLTKSSITGHVDTLSSKFVVLNDTVRFITGDEYVTIEDLIIKGDSLVSMDNGTVKDCFLRK